MQSLDRFEGWTPEEFQFTLSYAGRSAGTQRWISGPEKNHWVIRLETQFTGMLGGVRRVQVSKLEPKLRLPVSFSESDGQGGRHFETTFDRKTGLVTLRQNRDEASLALTQDYLDPLSVIQHLRELPEDTTSLRVPMVGGTVLVTRLPDQTLETPFGQTLARVYYLRPGIGLVYIEAAAPHRLLKLGQNLGKHMVESFLTRATEPQPGALEVRHERIRHEHRANEDNQGSKRRARGRRRRGGGSDQDLRTRGHSEGHRPSESNPARTERPAKPAQAATPANESTGDGQGKRRRRRRRSKRGGNKAPGGEQ